MTMAVVVPILGQYNIAYQCLCNILKTTRPETRVVLVENDPVPGNLLAALQNREHTCSEHPVADALSNNRVEIISPGDVVGVFESISLAAEHCDVDVLTICHYDVLFWKPAWDKYVIDAFADDEKLGLAGTVGAPGLAADGDRHGTVSRLLGKVWGGDRTGKVWQVHGGWTPDKGVPAAVLDGLVLFFRRSTISELLDASYPGLHHWYDREVSCAWNAAEWRVKVLPIEMDHFSGASLGSTLYEDAAVRRMKQLGITVEAGFNHDLMQYNMNEKHWRERWEKRLPLTVTASYERQWSA